MLCCKSVMCLATTHESTTHSERQVSGHGHDSTKHSVFIFRFLPESRFHNLDFDVSTGRRRSSGIESSMSNHKFHNFSN